MNYPTRPLKAKEGFALVLALSLMAFVLLLLLSLTTLIKVESRSAQFGASTLKAEQAAVLAAHLAIGQLQELTGADTRITADSRMFDANNVKLTGAWRSWEGSDRDMNDPDTPGKAIAPNYASKLVIGDPDVDIAATSDGRFLGWLSSISEQLVNSPDSPLPDTLISNTQTSGLVPLVSAASVPNPEDEVYLATTGINDEDSDPISYAWWTSGDNSKAMIQVEPSEAPASIRDWKQRLQSPSTPDPDVFGLANVDNLARGKSLVSRDSLGLAQTLTDELPFHDLTVFNRGLLTNTATGGWRRDLSLMTESYDGYNVSEDGDDIRISTDTALPEDGLPFYTLSPGEITYAKKADITSVDTSAGALVYPWAEYKIYDPRPNKEPRAWMRPPPICSWTALVDYAMKYKELANFNPSITDFSEITYNYWPPRDDGAKILPTPPSVGLSIHRFIDKARVAPVITRLQWVFALASRQDATDSSKYDLLLVVNPSITIWNPYNVQIEIPSDLKPGFKLHKNQPIVPLEFELEYNLGGTTITNMTTSLQELLKSIDSQIFNTLNFPAEPLGLPPGATRIYSTSADDDYIEGSRTLNLVEGYRAEGGYLIPLEDFDDLPSGTSVKITGVEAAQSGGGANATFELYSEFEAGGIDADAWRAVYDVSGMGSSVFEELYPPLIESTDPYEAEIQNLLLGSGDYAFAVAIMASRASTPLASLGENSDYFHEAVKFSQANPFVAYATMGERAMQSTGYGGLLSADSFDGSGLNHPVNAVHCFGFRRIYGWGDTENPGWIPQSTFDNESYIISGLDPTYGASRAVVAEIPTRPLQSLADLQHWDARNNNPIPPFKFNLIGNSSASPLIPADAVSIVGDIALLNRFHLNDDSYLLNNLLFDDWFVSSIAPDYGDSGVSEDRSLREVITEHLTGEEPLPNRFYLPSQRATNQTLSDTPELADLVDHVVSGEKDTESDKYAFETIASHLQVAGMFNVNSTSVDAWRALLRQGRDLQVPVIDEQGATYMDEAVSFAFPRTSIAGSTEVQSGDLMGQQVAGYQALTEVQIDALAEQIVEEIRGRGPFLSLSEFINRQLTLTDTDNALAGTIQRALDNLAELGNDPENPFAELQSESLEITSLPPGDPEFDFPEASYGHAADGVPGWVRQADILRPLAPSLSARDDTFTIRAYGDYRDPTDPSIILAKAWCEVTVIRTADFVDPADDATVLPFSNDMSSDINNLMGRKYQVVSFRWLNADEV